MQSYSKTPHEDFTKDILNTMPKQDMRILWTTKTLPIEDTVCASFVQSRYLHIELQALILWSRSCVLLVCHRRNTHSQLHKKRVCVRTY